MIPEGWLDSQLSMASENRTEALTRPSTLQVRTRHRLGNGKQRNAAERKQSKPAPNPEPSRAGKSARAGILVSCGLYLIM